MFRKSAIFRSPTICIESGALRAAWVFSAFMWTYCSTNFKPASDGRVFIDQRKQIRSVAKEACTGRIAKLKRCQGLLPIEFFYP